MSYQDLLKYAPSAAAGNALPAASDSDPSEPTAPAPARALPPAAILAAAPAAKPTAYDALMALAPKQGDHGFAAYATAQDGSSPYSAIPESPLGIVDRARLGWVRTPQNQQQLLEQSYGKGNVALMSTDGGAGFAVKDGGKWKQVDPAFEWKSAKLGQDLKDLPGDIAQFAGEYGLRSAAAGLGASAAMSAATPAIAAGAVAGGPLGGAAVGAASGLLGAAAGAGSAEALDQLSRAALNQNSIGGKQAHDPNELATQLYTSMLFGANQEAGAGVGKLGTKAAIGALASGVKALSDTPTGRMLAGKLLGVVSGQGEAMGRIRAEDPLAVAKYDSMAWDDNENQTSTLYDSMKQKVQGLYNMFLAKKQALGAQYDAVDEVASQLDYKPTEALSQANQELTNAGYIRGGKVVDYRGSKNVELDIAPEARKVLQYVTAQGQNMARKLSTGDSVSYDEMRRITQTLDTKLMENGTVTDLNLRRILGDFNAGLKSHLVSVLQDEDPATAQLFTKLNQRYGPVKELMGNLAPLTDDNKVDGFIKAITKDDGSFKSDIINNLSDLLGTQNPTQDLLQMHAARGSNKLWGGAKMMGVPVGTPKGAAALASGFSSAKSQVGQLGGAIIDSIPYMDKSLSILRSLPDATRKALLAHPQAVNLLMGTVSGAAQGEKQMTQQLLKQSGVVQ